MKMLSTFHAFHYINITQDMLFLYSEVAYLTKISVLRTYSVARNVSNEVKFPNEIHITLCTVRHKATSSGNLIKSISASFGPF
jgi:hypothetical protein